MATVAGLLEMPTRGIEVAGRPTGRCDGVGLTLTDGVDMQTVKARPQLAPRGRLHRHGGIAVSELDIGGRDLGAVGQFQLCGELLTARGLSFFLLTLMPTGRRGR